MIALLTTILLAAAEPAPLPETTPAVLQADAPVIGKDWSAERILEACRAMMPAEVKIDGHVNRRSRHGTEIAAYRYTLVRRDGVTNVTFRDKDGKEVPFERNGRLLDTDIVWNDLTMDFLWWTDVSLDDDAPATMSGILCKVLLLKNGDRAYRAWIDERTGAMLQANELVRDGERWKVVREVFCTSLKKFGDRWAPRNIEVGPPKNARYRTKIVVEDVR